MKKKITKKSTYKKKHISSTAKKNEKYAKWIENHAAKVIDNYRLADKKEKIVVACSGGKDSTTVLYIMHKLGYNVEALIIDLMIGGWSRKNLENIKKFCNSLSIKLHVISMRQKYGTSMCYIRQQVQKKNPKLSNCVICGVLKRWMLNRETRLLKADKIATGHNLNDEVSSVLMNFLKGNILMSLAQGPMTGVVADKKFIPRIKPLFFLTDAEIKKYSLLKKFPVLYEKCPCSTNAFRRQITNIITLLEKKNPEIRKNIMKQFFKIQLKLRKKYKTSAQIDYCTRCGEPSQGDVCSACRILDIKEHINKAIN